MKNLLMSLCSFLISTKYLVCRDMTKEDRSVRKLKKSSYSELNKLFMNEKWTFNASYPNSMFSEHAYYHAGIIRFGEVGYLVNIITWYRIILLQRKIRKNLDGFDLYKKPYIK